MQKREKSEVAHIKNIIPSVLRDIALKQKAKKGEKTHERLVYVST